MKVMDIKDIQKLLESFYEGMTSNEDERVLLDFFKENDVLVELKQDQQLFLQLHESEKKNVTSVLESRLNILIDSLDREEPQKSIKRKIIPINWKWISGVAASIVIIASAGLFFHKNFEKKPSFVVQDTYTDPKEAYRETQKTMLLVSNKLNKGLEQVGSVQNSVDKVNKIMNKNNIQL